MDNKEEFNKSDLKQSLTFISRGIALATIGIFAVLAYQIFT